jgi:hypothetical protein
MISKVIIVLVGWLGVTLATSIVALPQDPQQTLNLNYDAAGWNYHPESPLNKCNAHSLRLLKEIQTGPFSTTSSSFSTPLAYGGKFLISTTDGQVLSLDIATQSIDWKFNLRSTDWNAMPGITGLNRLPNGQIVPGSLNNAAQYTRTMAISPKYRSLYVGTSVGGILARYDLLTGGNTTTGDPAGFGQPIVKKLIHPYFLARSLNGLSYQKDKDGTEWIYMGLTSGEESGALCQGPPYPISCGFQSTFNKIHPVTLDIVWSFKACNSTNSTGCAIWNTPTFTDDDVCFGTGNNYDIAQSVKDCLLSGRSPKECDSEDNRMNSLICLRRDTGALVWSEKKVDEDLYTSACATDGTNPAGVYPRAPGCQTNFSNLDADMGHSTMNNVPLLWTNLTTGVTEKSKRVLSPINKVVCLHSE